MAEKTQATSSPALSMAERSERRRPPLPKVAPWLVIPYGKGRKNQAFYNLCDPDKRTCRKLIPELSGKSIFQKPCHQGWLVVACDDNKVDYSPTWSYGDCFLWNPATLETIQLPNINSSGYTFDDYYLVDCVLSSPPRSNNPSDGNDTMVFFVYERLDNECEYVFLYCRPGDKQWSTQKFTRQKHKMGPNFIVSLNYLKGDFYGMSVSSVSHFKIEIEQNGNVQLCIRQIETSNPIGSPSIGGSYTSVRNMYVQTGDELYRIDLRIAHQGDEFISIRIMRLDFSTMGWQEVNSLGDTVLFYSQNTTACCSAAELGLKRGCLYYTLANDQSLYKYELEGTGTIVLPCLKLPTPWYCSNWIMMPPTFRIGDGQQRTKFMLDKREEEDYIMNLIAKTTILAGNNNENPEDIYSTEEVKQQTPWSILNKDSLHMISSYLHPIDYKLLRSVCKENRLNLSLGKQRSTYNRIISNTCVSPWLLFSITKDCSVYNLVDPMDNNENYFMERPLLRGAIIRFQKGGWLLMSAGARKLFFYNPFTKDTIELPDFPDYYGLSNILFTSLPTCSDCVVFGVGESDKIGGGVQVYWIARGEKYWRYQEFCNIDTYEYYMPLLNTPVLYKGILYCVDYNGLLGTFSLESRSYKVLHKPYGTFGRAYPSFLVECGGDLLLVKLGRIGKFLQIFKLDFSKMEWVGVKSLGKYMLFISYTSCESRVAPCTGMENKIYFPRLSLHGGGVLFYSLDTGCYHSPGYQNSSEDFSDTKGWSSWSWIEPNWLRSTIQELDWFTTLP